MIITISGAASTGKTTLIEELKQVTSNRKEIKYYGEFIRTLFEEHYKDKYDSYADLLQGDPLDIIALHKETARLFNEVLWSNTNSHEILIFDRSPIDISIYLYLNLIPYLNFDNEYSIQIFKEYRKAVVYISRCTQDFLNHRPTIYYTRPFPQDNIVDDGFRPTSLNKRRSLEIDLFNQTFYSLPEAISILPDNLEDRVAMITQAIICKPR